MSWSQPISTNQPSKGPNHYNVFAQEHASNSLFSMKQKDTADIKCGSTFEGIAIIKSNDYCTHETYITAKIVLSC